MTEKRLSKESLLSMYPLAPALTGEQDASVVHGPSLESNGFSRKLEVLIWGGDVRNGLISSRAHSLPGSEMSSLPLPQGI